MNLYMLEQMAKHNQRELARMAGKRNWKQIFQLG
jgi:hypothetical protein